MTLATLAAALAAGNDPETAWFALVKQAARLAGPGFENRLWRHLKTGTVCRVVGCCLCEGDVAPCLLYVRHGDPAAVKWCRPLAEFLERFEEFP